MNGTFKRCTLCGREWRTKKEFLEDMTIHLNGHQYNRKKVEAEGRADGLLIFTHRIDECGTSLAIAVAQFRENFGLNRKRRGITWKRIQNSWK